jgi:hypothetical protein
LEFIERGHAECLSVGRKTLHEPQPQSMRPAGYLPSRGTNRRPRS